MIRRLPWWFASLCGIALAVLGAVLVFRPFESLEVLIVFVAIGAVVSGITEIVRARHLATPWLAVVVGLAWIALGVAVVAWPDATPRVLALLVGIWLVGSGLFEILAALRHELDERLASVVGGVARMIFGVLALAWTDVTVLVVAVVFGAALVIGGLRVAWGAFHHRHDDPSAPAAPARPRGRFRRFLHLIGTVVAVLVALSLLGVSIQIDRDTPKVDDFYTAPDDIPDESGVLVHSAPFTREVPDGATAWRILYTTTDASGAPALASGIVMTPTAPSDTPRPVVAWAHGTTGVVRHCAPSLAEQPFVSGAMFVADQVMDEGWILVATDYIGLGTEGPHPYLVGSGEAPSVLDAVRAARQLDDVDMADETVVWGHSQGGGAALWAGAAAADTPDVDVVGVAALAPASDLIGLADHLGSMTGGSLLATYVLAMYAQIYPDISVDDHVVPTARASFDAAVDRCLADPAEIVSILTAVAAGEGMFEGDLVSGALGTRLRENIPTGPIAAPLLIAQGEADTLVLAQVQAAYVAGRCADGQAIDFRTFPGRDHVSLVEADSPLVPELLAWTAARFAGEPDTPNCPGS